MISKSIVLFALMTTLTACAHDRAMKISNNNVKVAVIGLGGKATDQGYLVSSVVAESPAATAGIIEGDMLVAMDHAKLVSRKGFRDLLHNSLVAGREIEVEIIRAGLPMTVMVKPEVDERPPTFIKLSDLVESTSVTVAVIAGAVSSDMAAGPAHDNEKWKQSIRLDLVSEMESSLLMDFSGQDNLKLGGRSIPDDLLDEFKFKESGLVSAEMRARVGETYGITHLLCCKFTRFSNGNGGRSDVISRKLIDVKTGIVEASDYVRSKQE